MTRRCPDGISERTGQTPSTPTPVYGSMPRLMRAHLAPHPVVRLQGATPGLVCCHDQQADRAEGCG
jgi:hypothetical protein